jgi:hypothetical protein
MLSWFRVSPTNDSRSSSFQLFAVHVDPGRGSSSGLQLITNGSSILRRSDRIVKLFCRCFRPSAGRNVEVHVQTRNRGKRRSLQASLQQASLSTTMPLQLGPIMPNPRRTASTKLTRPGTQTRQHGPETPKRAGTGRSRAHSQPTHDAAVGQPHIKLFRADPSAEFCVHMHLDLPKMTGFRGSHTHRLGF